jgi:hypothetical protein
MTSRLAIAFGALLLAACDRFPADLEGSLDRIHRRGTICVGVQQAMPPEAEALLRRLESATGAQARRMAGSLEPQLQAIEDGDLDLVIAPFREDGGLATATTLSPPLRIERRGQHRIAWRAAMRSGENRWISLVEVQARQIGRGAK